MTKQSQQQSYAWNVDEESLIYLEEQIYFINKQYLSILGFLARIFNILSSLQTLLWNKHKLDTSGLAIRHN